MGKAERFLILEEELSQYTTALKDASQIIRDQDVSNYPIFIAHQQEISMGIPLFDKEKTKGKWNIHASSLEEFVVKNIVFDEKIEDFKKEYKDPDDYLCIFVLSELGAQFIYLPVK